MSAAERTLVRTLLARAGAGATLVRSEARSWASLTFEGQRHRLVLALPPDRAAPFAAGLEELEVALPGHVLADLVVEERADDPCGTHLTLGALILRAS